ncbi:MAG: ATP-dependent DNA helicase RecG [Mariprofundales bacterium]
MSPSIYAWLHTPINSLEGIGDKFGKRLRKQDIDCFGRLLLHLPKSYDDDRQSHSFSELIEGVCMRTAGIVSDIRSSGNGRSKSVHVQLVDDDGAHLRLTFFNCPWLQRDARMQIGSKLSVRGMVEIWQGNLQMTQALWQPVALFRAGWLPHYASLCGIGEIKLRQWIQQILALLPQGASSPLDDVKHTDFFTMAKALCFLHKPDVNSEMNDKTWQQARLRLQLEELWVYLYLLHQQHEQARQSARPIHPQAGMKNLLASLPFDLTTAQKKAWHDVEQDLISGMRMHRLLQGDVGSGKTVLAALAMQTAVDNSLQAALMAPTEVLAHQHQQSLQDMGLEVGLLTGSTRVKARRKILQELHDGSLAMVIGTHALLSDSVVFANLGLAVVDEQHRFGVQQRWQLTLKGENTHLLAMTATPIPRTLALALYGDMDYSCMRGMPPGRKPIITTLLTPSKRPKLAAGLRRILAEGASIYWIVPRIDDEENEKASVLQRTEKLQEHFPDIGVLALHGRMPSKQKQETLDSFVKGVCRLLVSTTVVEVGVHVPQARVMVIEHAESYGLAQLHQLRGRVGRAETQSYCVLLPAEEISQKAKQRLLCLTRSNDGIELAETDLKLRGAGEAVGVRQSGDAGFILLSEINDAELIQHWHANLPSDLPISSIMTNFWRPAAE